MTRRQTFALALPLSVAALGCSATYDKNFFDYDREQSRTRRVFEAQYAKAAMQESSLRASHFAEADDNTGPRLNAMGRERLEYIAQSRKPGEAVTVCIDADADPLTEMPLMVTAAEDYVAGMGLPAGAITIMVGPAETVSPAERSHGRPQGAGRHRHRRICWRQLRKRRGHLRLDRVERLLRQLRTTSSGGRCPRRSPRCRAAVVSSVHVEPCAARSS